VLTHGRQPPNSLGRRVASEIYSFHRLASFDTRRYTKYETGNEKWSETNFVYFPPIFLGWVRMGLGRLNSALVDLPNTNFSTYRLST
jgi:hypothetical protein